MESIEKKTAGVFWVFYIAVRTSAAQRQHEMFLYSTVVLHGFADGITYFPDYFLKCGQLI